MFTRHPEVSVDKEGGCVPAQMIQSCFLNAEMTFWDMKTHSMMMVTTRGVAVRVATVTTFLKRNSCHQLQGREPRGGWQVEHWGECGEIVEGGRGRETSCGGGRNI